TVRGAPALREDPLTVLPAPVPAPADWEIRRVPEARVYRDAVTAAVQRMRAGGLSKAVLARTLELTSSQPLELPAILQRLARRDPEGYTFAVPAGPGRTLLGASPELLVSRRGTQLTANPLAGSVPR
ncbi:chorismate-binding protein, partial [Streptomyces daliensis]|nr:chorismate-binding protein [Streptomyces daliensis]